MGGSNWDSSSALSVNNSSIDASRCVYNSGPSVRRRVDKSDT